MVVKDEFANVIFGWGNNDRSQLGLGVNTAKVNRPKLLPASGLQVAKIACGINHTLCLTNSGQVFYWGLYYMTTQHGQKEHTGCALQPKLMESLAQHVTIDIAAGSGHSLAVTDKKELYAWGAGKLGELGVYSSKYENLRNAEKVAFDGTVSQVSAGVFHSCAITTNGKLIVWGGNRQC